jgi:hypothetical protein
MSQKDFRHNRDQLKNFERQAKAVKKRRDDQHIARQERHSSTRHSPVAQ